MTREEAIKELEEMIKYEWSTYQTSTAKTYVAALEIAIKALEQELILDKLRAEIDLDTRIQVKHYTNTDAVIDAVLEVIDNYNNAESEDENLCGK